MKGSFRIRLTAWNVGILAFSLLGFGIGILTFTRHQVSQTINAELLQRATQFSREIRNGRGPQGNPPNGNNPNPNGEPRLPALQDDDFDPQFRRLYELRRPRSFDPQGNPRGPAQEPPLDPRALKLVTSAGPIFTDLRIEQVPIRIVTLRFQNTNRQPEIVQVATDINSLDRITSAQAHLLIIFFPLAIIIAATAGMFLTRTAFKPIELLTEAAEKIDESNLNERLQVQGNDELSRLSTKFNEMVARLEQAFQQQNQLLQSQKQFTADASHELRTPLTRIRLAADTGLDQSADEDDKNHSLQVIDQAAQSMTYLVDQLLTLARNENLKLTPPPVSDLLPAIHNSIELSNLKEDQRLSLELPAEPLVAPIHPEHLTQILTNLLTNAARHTASPGKIQLSVNLALNQLEIQVKDQGEGISPDNLKRVSERFFRADESRSTARGGNGLGLSIVRQLVENYQGTLEIDSQLAKGTTVKIFLPITNNSQSS